MAVPTLITDLTMIDTADSGTDWSGWGQNSAKWDDEADIYLEGAGSQGCQPNQVGDGGWGHELASSIDLSATGNRLFIWVYTTPGFINTSANYGVYIRVCSDTGDWVTDYQDYIVGGSNVEWVGRGWHLVAIDCSQEPSRTNGSTTLTNINRVGVGFTHTTTASKSTVSAIDIMYYGTYVEATSPSFTDGTNGIDFNENGASADTIYRQDAGSWITDGFEAGDRIRVYNTADNDGIYTIVSLTADTLTLSVGDFTADNLDDTDAIVDAYIGLGDIYEKDGPTDDDWYGIITKNPLGVWEINYTLYLGDQSGGDRCHFYSSGEVIYFADQWLGDNELSVIATEDTDITVFTVGESDGAGDDRVGFSGSIFSHDNDFHDSLSKIDLSTAIEGCSVFGTTFLNIGGGVSFAADTSHYVTNCTFSECGQIDLGSVEARNLTFAGYEEDADAALLWNVNIDIKNSSFVACTDETNDPHAIEHDYPTTVDYNDLTFGGNDYDINFSALSGYLTINNVGISNVSTYEITVSGYGVTINTGVPLKVTVKDTAGDAIYLSQVAIFTSGHVQLMNEDTDIDGIAQETYNYLGDKDVYIRARKSSVGNTRYVPHGSTGTITSTGLNVTVTLRNEPLS